MRVIQPFFLLTIFVLFINIFFASPYQEQVLNATFKGTILNKGGIISPGYSRDTTHNLTIGADYTYSGDAGDEDYQPFIEFNTTIIPEDANVTFVSLNLTVLSYQNDVADPDFTLAFTNYNMSRASNITQYPDTSAGNQKVWDNIGFQAFFAQGRPQYITVGEKNQTLNIGAVNNLSTLLIRDYLTIGIIIDGGSTTDEAIHTIGINATNGTMQPELTVIYTTCQYRGWGNWEINRTCNLRNNVTNVLGNLSIYESGQLNLLGNYTLNFSLTNNLNSIHIYHGGVYTSGYNVSII